MELQQLINSLLTLEHPLIYKLTGLVQAPLDRRGIER